MYLNILSSISAEIIYSFYIYAEETNRNVCVSFHKSKVVMLLSRPSRPSV